MTVEEGLLLVYGLFLAYFVTLQGCYLGLLAIGVFRVVRRSRESRFTDLGRIAESDLTVPVSVIIPSFDEAESVLDTVRSALRARFPKLEVIVVDDGSTDETLERLQADFDLVPRRSEPLGVIETAAIRSTWRSRKDDRLWVIHKENGGKADAVNAGVNLAHYRYVLLTDADCVFEPDGILRMIRPINFDPARVVGLGATIRCLNGCEVEDGRVRSCTLPGRWVERFQLLEYSTIFLSQRLGWAGLNAVPVISGAAGLWRKDSIREIGGFSAETTHEDLDTTLRLHRHFREADEDYRIDYLPGTAARTEAPHSWSGLYRQRKRWQRTLYESTWRHRRMLLNTRYGTVGTLLMPYLVVYEAVGPLVEVAAWVLTGVVLATGLVAPGLLAAFLLTAAGLVAALRLTSLLIDLIYYEDRSLADVARLTITSLGEFWTYRPFVLVARLHAFVEFLQGRTGHERAERSTDGAAPKPEPV